MKNSSKHLYLSSLILFSFCFSLLAQEEKIIPERIFTLKESLEQAALTCPSLKRTKEDIQIAEHRVTEAYAMGWPQLDLNANYTRYKAQSLFVLPPTYGNILLPPNGLEKDFYAARLSFSQLIYSGGRYRDTCNLAQSHLERTKNEYNQALNQVLFNTAKAFYDLLFLKKKLAIYQNLIAAEKKFLTGLPETQRSRYQEETMKLRIEELQNELIDYKNDYDLGRLNFLDTIGLELNTIIDIQGDLEPISEKIDLYKLVALAFEQRPERLLVQAQERMDALSLNLSQAERNPTITFGANYQWEGEITPLRQKDWNTTLNLNIPIFDGRAKWAKVRQKKGQVEKVKLTKTEIDDQIRLEVAQASTEYNYWQEQTSNRTKELANTEKLLPMAQDELQNKRIRPDDFFLFIKNYWLCRLRRLESVHKLLTARAKLDQAVGNFWKTKK
ncbi:MAG: TolC family protein [Elusimicrobiota bacterium]